MVGLPGAAAAKNPPAKAEEVDLILVSGRPPEGGNGNPLPFSCLENPGDRGAWWAAVHGVTLSRTRLSDRTAATVSTTLKFAGFSCSLRYGLLYPHH